MSDNYDDFEDIIHNSFGIAEGAGLDSAIADIDAVQARAMPDGVAFEFRCQGCGRPRRLTLDYQELVALHFGLSPHVAYHNRPDLCPSPSEWSWRANERPASWGLHLQCNRCHQYHYPLRLTPQEPKRYLDQARKAGFINPAGEQHYVHHCRQVAQAAQA